MAKLHCDLCENYAVAVEAMRSRIEALEKEVVALQTENVELVLRSSEWETLAKTAMPVVVQKWLDEKMGKVDA